MSILSKIHELPRWSIPVVGISVLLLALSVGIVRWERSGTSDRARHSDRAAIEVGRPSAAGVRSASALATARSASASSEARQAGSKWGADDSRDSAWTGGDKWDDGADPEELASLDCVIEPHQIVSIRSPVIGMLDAVHFERSDPVEAGDILVELESGAERATVDLARVRAEVNTDLKSREATLELSKRRSSRAARLYASNTLSLDLLEEIDTEAELAGLELQHAGDEARLAALEHIQALERLKRRTIRSPISGIVIERLMSAGEVVDDEVILRVAQIDPLRVEIVLPASGFGTVEPGTKVAVIPEIPGDEVHMGSVTIVDRVIDAASGTFGARLELPNPDGVIPSGLHCQVRFIDE